MPSKYNEHFGVGCVFCAMCICWVNQKWFTTICVCMCVCGVRPRVHRIWAQWFMYVDAAKTALWFIIFQQKSFELGIQRCKFVINFAFFYVRDANDVYTSWKCRNKVNISSLYRELWRVKQQRNVITFCNPNELSELVPCWRLIGHTRREGVLF